MTIEIKQTETFRLWESKLKDKRVRTLIATRLSRLAEGLPGDIAPVGNGVSELRIHYGPGYRVYLQQRGTILVVLLCGGDKSTQARDISLAKKLAQEWKE
ncbi:putative addiction module killer protein [Burkholderia sp. D7]|jgi:putative addiction module killer protein|nr:putative addiction module killer protein [Burkholderia sp. D7]